MLKSKAVKRKTFLRITGASLIIFVLSFGIWLNFSPKNENSLNAENENSKNSQSIISANSATNSQIIANENSDNYTVKKLNYIQFDGNEYINTGTDQVGDTKIKTSAEWGYGGAPPLPVWSMLFGAREIHSMPASNQQSLFAYSYNGTEELYENAIEAYWNNDEHQHERVVGMRGNGAVDLTFDNRTVEVADSDGAITTTDFSDLENPTIPYEIYLGSVNDGGAASATEVFVGRVFSFQIHKNDILVRNLIPAARYICGENSAVEYGFANDLDNDGNFANDEWFSNANRDNYGNEIGQLTSDEEITETNCPIEPPENSNDSENPPTETATPPIVKSENILPPNTGFFCNFEITKNHHHSNRNQPKNSREKFDSRNGSFLTF